MERQKKSCRNAVEVLFGIGSLWAVAFVDVSGLVGHVMFKSAKLIYVNRTVMWRDTIILSGAGLARLGFYFGQNPEVRSIDESTRLNRALWVLADELARHKGSFPVH